MDHLSGIDAAFLHLESAEMPMHVGSLNVLELPEGYTGDFYEDVKRHVAQRMHLVPVFERKLAPMPFELANPVWVNDNDVDLDYHVRRIVLSKPGSMHQLEQYVARLHSSLLDQSRPLWEFYVIEGLEGGRVAFYSKLHHAAIDGQAGIAIANAILDLSPEPRTVRARRIKRGSNEYQLGVAELAAAAVSNAARQAVKLVRLLPEAARITRGLLKRDPDAPRAQARPLLSRLQLPPRTPLNVAITNQRAFATLSLSFAETRSIAKVSGTTLNDVVLAVCAGALRRYLSDPGPLPERALTAFVPVSLREAGNTQMNNQVAGLFIKLGTDISDPVKRLHAIHAATASAKSTNDRFRKVIPTDFPSLGAPWLVRGLASLYGRSRLANMLPPVCNVVVSNVPGPQMPLYLAGARLISYYPVSIVTHGMALNITVQSYDGRLDVGLIACRRAMPDLHDFAEMMRDSHAALRDRVLADAPQAQVVALPAAVTQAAARPSGARKPAASLRSPQPAEPALADAPAPAGARTARKPREPREPRTARAPRTPRKPRAAAPAGG